MPRNWNSLADGSEGIYVADDFKRAMYQLVTHQCLYSRFNHHSTAFRLISKYRDEFEEAVALLGLRLGFNDRLEFCYLTPEVVKDTPLGIDETRFLLVLRQLYHLKGSAGDLSIDGDAYISLDELESTYRSMTGEELDSKVHVVRGLVKMASKKGMAKLLEKLEDDPQPFAIIILPAIAEILSEHAVARFGAQVKSGLVVHSASANGADREEVNNEGA